MNPTNKWTNMFESFSTPTPTPVEEGIDIEGVDKNDLLKSLWENSSPSSFFTGNGLVPLPWKAPKFISGYIDYYLGRPIMMDISKDTLDPEKYDSDECTLESAETVVKELE